MLLRDRPELAPDLIKVLSEKSAALSNLKESHEADAGALAIFGMPAQDQARALRIPLSTVQSTLHCARRALADAAYPLEQELSRLEAPLLLITGDSDNVDDNDLAFAGLKAWGPPFA